jgi:Dolichyl-phosphate-mannose-protein mannosyltransferase
MGDRPRGDRTLNNIFSSIRNAFAQRWVVATCVFLMLAAMYGQLALMARWHSMTCDEGNHIYSGYMSWTRADFGLNPEHPPLVKLLATAPLLKMALHVPEPAGIFYKYDAYVGGREMLSGTDKETILFRTRMAVGLLAVLLALLAFAAAREMFGLGAGLLALALAAFDPNLLGLGALVTTDTGVSCFLLATVYAFYRYVKSPSAVRLVLTGLCAGLALAAKHNGIFLGPILILLGMYECARMIAEDRAAGAQVWKRPVRLAAALALIVVLAVGVLWAFYGFRYSARPQGMALQPPMPELTSHLNPGEAKTIALIAKWKLLPESYLFGAADVRTVGEYYHSFILGHIYPHGVWFYFPVVLTIKCTEGLLALLLITGVAIVVRALWKRREILFLAIPAAVCLAVPMSFHLNTGVRHIMPVYAFLWPLAAGAAYTVARGRWAWVLTAAAVLHVGASLTAFHNRIPYANFFWGGPNNTHTLLTDSNADWGQQLNGVREYLANRGVKNCWFSYIGEGETRMAWWGIPCTPMPNLDAPDFSKYEIIPKEIDGPVLISADEWSGYLTGPGPLNPYGDFHKLQPSAIIGGGVLVYDGHFSVPRLSAVTRRYQFDALLKSDPRAALESAKEIAALDPDNADSWTVLGRAELANGMKSQAQSTFQHAIDVAQTVEPDFQKDKVPGIRALTSGS